MPSQAEKAETFAALHRRAGAFVMPNPWDAGSAKVLASLGFEALATTSAGAAFTLGLPDGAMSRAQSLANVRAIAEATSLPVNGDLENLFAHAPDEAASTIPLAAAAGLVGCSIEDATGEAANPIYEFDAAVARVKAAVIAARALPFKFTLTARAENHLHGRNDLADTIKRLQAFEAAGADVLYAPGLWDMGQVRAVLASVKAPVNILVSSPNAAFTRDELAAAGVRRISTGGAPARAAYHALLALGREMHDRGTFTYGRDLVPTGQLTKIFKGDQT